MMRCTRLAAVLAFGLMPIAAWAAADNIVPYMALYQSLRPALEVSKHPRLIAHTRVVSKLRHVAPTDIALEVRSRNGLQRVAASRRGDLDFPLDDALRDENPPVFINQPKGSLTLSVDVQLRPPAGRHFPYRELAAGLDDMRALLRSDGAEAAWVIDGLELWFAPDAGAQVHIEGAIERVLLADRHGRIVLADTRDLHADGVMLKLSAPPLAVVPTLRRRP